ncbi:PilZ domain-containing protein [Chthonobacter albigriseus]|uniref:PilZ domain-containing protein n=1 Tax=Chthonobacter albigriseus TaxID=1683161 RepID=UPI0015EEB767|nr:PilZ domain-containing protein [Chthonobacter albigriseus]
MRIERAVKRRLCSLPATVYSDGLRTDCAILDISERGCQLEGDVFGLGNEVEIHFQDAKLCVPGTVAWKTYMRVGIHFKATIGLSEK